MESILNLNHAGDNFTIDQTLIYKELIDKGYTSPLAEVMLDRVDLDKLIAALSKYNFKIYDYSSNNNFFQTWFCEDFSMDVLGNNKNIFVTTYCKSMEISSEIFKIIQTFEPSIDEMEVFFYSYFMQGSNLDHSFKTFKFEDFKKSNEKYYPYIDTNAMFEQFYTNKENIMILCGKPGTGKTSLSTQLLKYSLKNPTKIPYVKDIDDIEYLQVAYIKSTEVLANDSLWRTLSQKEYDLVILDDLDYFLTARDQEIQTSEDVERNKFLNQFLSFTDGIEQNRTKFIITTNQSFDDIDTALLRKGRLFDILELRELTNTEALEIWKTSGLAEKDFVFAGSVLQADLGSEIEKKLNNKIVQKPYLKEEDISKMKRSKKKLGF